MNKIRRSLAIIVLVATLSGLSLQGMGAGLMANATASQPTHSISASQSAKPVALKIRPPCPGSVTNDC